VIEVRGIFLGYESGTKGYRVYDLVGDRLIISRDVLFDEKKAWNWGESVKQVDEATCKEFLDTRSYKKG